MLIERGARLPPIRLEGDTGEVRLSAPELGSPALLFVRDTACDGARDYVASWKQSLADLIVWYGRPIVVGGPNEAEPGRAHESVSKTAAGTPMLETASASTEAWDALGIPAGASALVIADRWGMVYFAQSTTTFKDLPNAGEVEEWLRFLATQCPECGVIDEPGYGEWAS